MHPAIEQTLAYHTDEEPTGTQDAFHAVVHLVVPGTDEDGHPIDADQASDWIAEILRDQVLDWGYVHTTDPGELGERQTPIPITVCEPYIEGTFLTADD